MQFDQEMFDEYANPADFKGTDLKIIEWPNPILRAENALITEFDDDFQNLCSEFFSVMYGANGVGLAAPQVGLSLQLFVYNPDPTAPGALRKMGERVVCNPKVIEFCGATNVDIEGCLSSRSECCRGDIKRCKELRVEYQDEHGNVKKKRLRGFEARVFQHEYDHLQGVLHIDRQSASDRKAIQPFLDVLLEQHGPGGALDLTTEKVASLQPRPPPTAPGMAAVLAAADSEAPAVCERPEPVATSSGFGAGVGANKKGSGGAKSKKKRKK